MKRKFEVGDKAVVVLDGLSPERIGTVVTVLAYHSCALSACDADYEVDLPSTNELTLRDGIAHACYAETDLAPYYDGGEKASWADCVWKPKQIKARA